MHSLIDKAALRVCAIVQLKKQRRQRNALLSQYQSSNRDTLKTKETVPFVSPIQDTYVAIDDQNKIFSFGMDKDEMRINQDAFFEKNTHKHSPVATQ